MLRRRRRSHARRLSLSPKKGGAGRGGEATYTSRRLWQSQQIQIKRTTTRGGGFETNSDDDDEEEDLKPIARRLSFAQPTPSAQNVIKCSNRENCGAPLSLSL
jgi:hypothetical protein